MEMKNFITVPAEAIAERDYHSALTSPEGKDGPKMVMPRAGDPVDFHVKGSVESIEGGNAMVRIAFINGKRADAKPVKAAKPDPDAEMLNAAREADEEG